MRTPPAPLHPIIVVGPFAKWGIDFITCNPHSAGGHAYIILAVDYFSKWAEMSTPLQTYIGFADGTCHSTRNISSAAWVIYSPSYELVSMHGVIKQELLEAIGIKLRQTSVGPRHKRSTPYHPRANGQVESTNKKLEGIITKTVAMNIKNWEEKLKDALWAYRITWKNTTGFTPYQLVYGKEVMLPIEFQIHTFKMAAYLGIDLNEAQQERIQRLNQLDEMR
eukprot:PITA_33561